MSETTTSGSIASVAATYHPDHNWIEVKLTFPKPIELRIEGADAVMVTSLTLKSEDYETQATSLIAALRYGANAAETQAANLREQKQKP